MENLNTAILDELERRAYITGDTARAAWLGALDDKAAELEILEETIKSARKLLERIAQDGGSFADEARAVLACDF